MLPDYRDPPGIHRGSTGICPPYGGFMRRAHAVRGSQHAQLARPYLDRGRGGGLAVGRCFLRHRPAQVPGPGARRGSPGPGARPSFRACACACLAVPAPAASRLFTLRFREPPRLQFPLPPLGLRHKRSQFGFSSTLASVLPSNRAADSGWAHNRPEIRAVSVQHHRFVRHIFNISFSRYHSAQRGCNLIGSWADQ